SFGHRSKRETDREVGGCAGPCDRRRSALFSTEALRRPTPISIHCLCGDAGARVREWDQRREDRGQQSSRKEMRALLELLDSCWWKPCISNRVRTLQCGAERDRSARPVRVI